MSNLIGKSINCNLYTVSDDINDTDSSHIASIVAVNKLNEKIKNIDISKEFEIYEQIRKKMIGVPVYWRSTTLPENYCWANGDFIEFINWPELEEVYRSGGFEGMLLPWNASSGDQAANLGKWRPDAANPTGLFTPNLGGQFFRNWGQGTGAGGTNRPGVPEIDGHLNFGVSDGVGTGAFRFMKGASYGQLSSTNIAAYSFNFAASRCSSIYGNSDTVMPQSVNQPVVIYLGRQAQV